MLLSLLIVVALGAKYNWEKQVCARDASQWFRVPRNTDTISLYRDATFLITAERLFYEVEHVFIVYNDPAVIGLAIKEDAPRGNYTLWSGQRCLGSINHISQRDVRADFNITLFQRHGVKYFVCGKVSNKKNPTRWHIGNAVLDTNRNQLAMKHVSYGTKPVCQTFNPCGDSFGTMEKTHTHQADIQMCGLSSVRRTFWAPTPVDVHNITDYISTVNSTTVYDTDDIYLNWTKNFQIHVIIKTAHQNILQLQSNNFMLTLNITRSNFTTTDDLRFWPHKAGDYYYCGFPGTHQRHTEWIFMRGKKRIVFQAPWSRIRIDRKFTALQCRVAEICAQSKMIPREHIIN